MTTVSIIIPARNEEAIISRCLSFAHRAISVSQISCEIILVNDASTDNTKVIAQNWGCRIYDVNYKNRSKARNYGAKQSKGKYLLFVDADTLISSQLLSNSLCSITNNRKVLWYRQMPIEKDYKGVVYNNIINIVAKYYPLHCPAIFCEKDTFYFLNEFNDSLRSFEDHHFLRSAWQNKIGSYCHEKVYTSIRRYYKYGFWGIIKQNYYAIRNPYDHEWTAINE